MLFNSYVFLFAFLPAVLVGWWGLTRWRRLRLAFLTSASCGSRLFITLIRSHNTRMTSHSCSHRP